MHFNFIQKSTYMRKYNKLLNACNSAEKQGLKECQKCGLCCWQRPCSLAKEDLLPIAEFLKIGFDDLFKNYLAVDLIGHTYYLTPIRKEQRDLAGRFILSSRTFDINTPCIFFDNENKNCKIHEVKPKGAKVSGCWIENEKESLIKWERSDLIALGWDGMEDDYSY